MPRSPREAVTTAPVVEQVNEEIRTFMRARLGRSLWPEEADEYARLLERWQWAARAGSPRRPEEKAFVRPLALH
jgi:hypothetical protein